MRPILMPVRRDPDVKGAFSRIQAELAVSGKMCRCTYDLDAIPDNRAAMNSAMIRRLQRPLANWSIVNGLDEVSDDASE
jgi:hypothetical protein